MTNGTETWDTLPVARQIAFEEAWRSWVFGSAFVGSVISGASLVTYFTCLG